MKAYEKDKEKGVKRGQSKVNRRIKTKVKESPRALRKQGASREQKRPKHLPPLSSLSHLCSFKKRLNTPKDCKKLIKSEWDYGSHTPLPPFGGSFIVPFSCFFFFLFA